MASFMQISRIWCTTIPQTESAKHEYFLLCKGKLDIVVCIAFGNVHGLWQVWYFQWNDSTFNNFYWPIYMCWSKMLKMFKISQNQLIDFRWICKSCSIKRKYDYLSVKVSIKQLKINYMT